MSYYPDTDEIRMAYLSAHKSDAYGSDATTLEVEFNRWFEYEQSKVASATEERIIKLLEDPATMSNWWAMPDKSLGLYGNLKNYVIALIKGEQK